MAQKDFLGQVIDHPVEDVGEVQRFGGGLPPLPPEPPFGSNNNNDRHDDDEQEEPPVSNARLGMFMFLGAEGMFFAGLIGAFLVFRFGSVEWPPPFQPRLPVEVTGVNTLILLISAFTMRGAFKSIRSGDYRGLVNGLFITLLLGALFLGVQGYEWIRLVGFGLTLSSGIYGSTFYTLIGLHGAHVLGAVIWLLIVLGMARGNRFSASHYVGVELCGMYWYFVVGLWPILFTLVYLS